MAQKYFNKFSKIVYNDQLAIDITKRVKIVDSLYNNPYLFYKYDISDGERADQLSNYYYNDQYMTWLIYISNNIVDPYYDWYMDDDTFNGVMQKKYGISSYVLQNKIHHYTNNWYQEQNLTLTEYAALQETHHKYWQPVYDQNSDRVLKYVRVKSDWKINTNSVIKYNCNGNNFIKDEIVKIVFNNNVIPGKAQVVFSNTSSLVVHHVSGTLYTSESVSITGSSHIYGIDSHSNVVFTAVTNLVNNIEVGEEVYWDAVSVYDYEREKNETNKSIRVVDKKYSTQFAQSLENLLK